MKSETEVRKASNKVVQHTSTERDMKFRCSATELLDLIRLITTEPSSIFRWCITEFYLHFQWQQTEIFLFFNKLLSTTNLMQVILTLLPLKEQRQDDATTEGNNVGTKCVMDYSDQFTTYSVHNHDVSEYLQGHSFVGRLSEEKNAFLVDMSNNSNYFVI